MILFHSTDEAGKIGIEAEGFAKSDHLPSEGKSWFFDEPSPWTAARRGWFVQVRIPLEVALPFADLRSDLRHVPSRFEIPWQVVNLFQPFAFMREDNLDPALLDSFLRAAASSPAQDPGPDPLDHRDG